MIRHSLLSDPALSRRRSIPQAANMWRPGDVFQLRPSRQIVDTRNIEWFQRRQPTFPPFPRWLQVESTCLGTETTNQSSPHEEGNEPLQLESSVRCRRR